MHHMRPRKPSKQPPPPVPLGVQALSELRREEFDATPFGTRGEIAEVRPAEPQPVPPEPLRIEPPPWAGKEGDPGEPVQSPQPLDRAAIFGGYAPPEPNFGPPERLEPLTRPKFEPPDWEAEERERARRAAAEKREAELEPEHERYPAKKTNRTWRNL
jgi:hypothetical protein